MGKHEKMTICRYICYSKKNQVKRENWKNNRKKNTVNITIDKKADKTEW